MKRILVVDDMVEQRELLNALLSDEYDVVEADSGKNAVLILEDQKIDLILSDMEMPNGDGMWLLEYLRSQTTKTPPVIILSGKSEVKSTVLQKAGAIGFFPKPFSITSLKAFIEEIIFLNM